MRVVFLMKYWGFSLLELLFCLAFLGLLGLVVFFDSSEMLPSKHLEYENKRLKGFLELMALKASQHEIRIVFRWREGSYGASSDNLKYKQAYKLHKSLKLQSAVEEVYFYPSGVNSPATFILSDANHLCTLKLALRGRVKSSCSD